MSNGKRAARRSNANIVIRRHSKHHRNYLKARAHGNSCFVVVPERQKTAGWVLTTSSGTVNGWVESGRAARSKSYNDDLVRLEKAAARNTAQTGKVDRLPSGCGTMRGERVDMVRSVGIQQILRKLGQVSSARTMLSLHGVRVFRMAQRLRCLRRCVSRPCRGARLEL